MRPEEIEALGDLAGDAAAGATKQIQEIHTGIARRVWRRVGPASLPVRLAHDRIASGRLHGGGRADSHGRPRRRTRGEHEPRLPTPRRFRAQLPAGP